ncbi:MAG: diguanylate cyclase [Lachnospiraceae bacterium]|nr:diguanylate cyclase [Lachnospiraceae bacterium]
MQRVENKEIEYKINRNLIIGWLIIVGILLVAYFGEFLKGQRTGRYMLIFSAVTAVPALVCALLFWRDHHNHNLRYFIIGGYFVMYVYVLLTGNTTLVFTYILPLLSLIVLYHQPKLVVILWLGSVAANLIFIARQFVEDKITVETSKDIEIQVALLFLCFGFLLVASRIYDDLYRKNEAYMQELAEKQRQLQRVTLQTITTIANIIDAKDEYTKGHSQRVADYSAAIAEELGYGEEYVNNVRYIGLLHDIGKIGIPDSILNKPGKLTDEEFELMKRHVEIGGNILKDNRMIKDLSDGARYHHERYDGRGYMQHLKGEEIPEIARIIGLADAYDAMTSNRVYRKRLTDEQVIAELERCSGSQFDPRIARVFIDLLKQGRIKQLSPDAPAAAADEGSTLEQSTKLLQDMIRMQKEKDVESEERDYLTGAYTRRVGERKIAGRLTEQDGALLLVDITNLNEINSRHGFFCGDHLIRHVAQVLDAFRPGMLVTRFGGDEFICCLDGVTRREDMEQMMQQLHERIGQCIREMPVYEGVQVCAGGALSVTVGREYMALFSAADKALYYMKQLRKGGWYLYETSERRGEDGANISRLDLEQLVANIVREGSYESVYCLDYPELNRIYDFVRKVSVRSRQDIQLILITLKPLNEKTTTVEERDEAMGYMEKAVNAALRKADIMMRFSSTQYLIFFMNLGREQIPTVTNRIMNNFYRSYDKKTMSLTYDVAELKNEEME